MTYSLHEAKAKLSELIKLAEAGETVEITRHGKVVAYVSGAGFPRRQAGWAKGTFRCDEATFEFTDDEIDELFHGPIFPGES